MTRRPPALPILALGLLALPAAAAEPGADLAASQATIQSMRAIGTATFAWVTDQDTPPRGDSATAEEDSDTFDWSRCPSIAHADLAALVVPDYISRLPETDGWGHPFELCLAREALGGSRYVLGVRSPGRDGEFEGTTYTSGAFPANEPDRDLVWIDGFFVRWPQKE